MDENEETGHNFTLLLLLFISVILVLVDGMELYHIIINWEYGMKIITPIFESCIKWELYTKTVFAIFSLLGAFSSVSLVIFLLVDTNWFADKILTTFLYFNYMIFGPYMLGFTIIGFANWNNVVYTCDKQNFNNKIFSPSNTFSLIGCFILSLIITCLVTIYKTVNLYINSTLRRPGGNVLLRKLFWWSVFRNREPVEFVRRAQQATNEREDVRNNI